MSFRGTPGLLKRFTSQPKVPSLNSAMNQESCKMRTSSHKYSHLHHERLKWSTRKNSYSQSFKIKLLSFNLLAPVYKRLPSIDPATGFHKREANHPEMWQDRAHRAMEFFRREVINKTDIIGFQEFWLEQNYIKIFEKEFESHGYNWYLLQRPGRKTDAVAIIIKSSVFDTLGVEKVYLHTMGDRVALLLWLRHRESQTDFLVANTHLSFPHNSMDRLNQMQQMKNLTTVIEMYAFRHNISLQATRIVMGDFNVESQSPVCDHLRNVGYVSCFEVSPPINAAMGLVDSLSGFVSHRNHNKEDVGVDHIFIKQSNHTSLSTPTAPLLPPHGLEENITTSSEEELLGRSGSKHDHVFIESCVVLPRDVGCREWIDNFNISDHRPVMASIIYGRPVSSITNGVES